MAQLLKPGSKLGTLRPLRLKEPKGMSTPHVPHFGGLFHADTPGRQDNQHVAVKPDSYIIPADVVSGLGSGNTAAGGKVLDHLTSGGPSGGSAPAALNPVSLPGGPTPFAKGGMAPMTSGGLIKIIVAGGEYHVPPEAVKHIGGGSIKSGHKILDSFVKKVREKTIKDMKGLAPPKK